MEAGGSLRDGVIPVSGPNEVGSGVRRGMGGKEVPALGSLF